MIKLVHLDLQNFLSHVNTSLSLEDYKGLVLIEGVTSDGHYSSNGAGKSTILEGILYALTGNTLRGVGVNDIVNRNRKKNTKVSLRFYKDDILYRIDRYRKDDNFGDAIVFFRGEEDISKRVNKETQKLIDDTVGISYTILVSTILLGEGLSSKFTQLSDPDKKSLIESTLNLNYNISDIRSKANDKLSQLKLSKANLEGRLSTLRELSSLDVEETQRQLEKIESTLAEASKEKERLGALQTKIQAERAPLEDKMKLLMDTINKYNSLSSELKRLDAESLRYIEELTSAESSPVPHCTLCHQSLVSEESINSFKNTYKEKIESVQSKMHLLRGELDSLPELSILEEKYRVLREDSQSMYEQLLNISNDIQNLSITYGENNSKRATLEERLKSHNSAVDDISSLEESNRGINEEIMRYEYFYKLFSPTGIIVNILSEAIEYINTRLSTYSEILLEKEYHINFLKGKISLVDDKGSSYQSLSNGEKRRLDIAIQFSLHDYIHMYCGLQTNCCFIDEILDTVDDTGIENIFDILRLKIEYCSLDSIYVITHNSSLKSKFDKIITVVKDNAGESSIK